MTERDGSVLVAWDETTRTGRSVRLARGKADARGQVTFRSIGVPESGRYPSLAMTNGGALVTWAQPIDGGSMIAVAPVGR